MALSGVCASATDAAAKPASHAAARSLRAKPGSRKLPHRIVSAHGRATFKLVRRNGRLIRVRVAPPPAKPEPLLEADSTPHAYAACSDAPAAFVKAAALNARSLGDLDWTPFGSPEKGWQVYDLLVGREIGANCGSGTPVFAEKLAAFQARFQLPADGVFTPVTFEKVKGLLQEERPFVMFRVAKVCPDAPSPLQLMALPKEAETFQREDRLIRTDVFAAYQRMVAAARAELPSLKDDPKALTIFSAYRSPEADAARCDLQGNCDGLHRAVCSAHRTGTALDMNVGWVDGVAADSTSPENRLLQTRTAPYRWLVMNAGRFGFVNYAYEPWHWEWIGEPGKPALGPIPPPPAAPAAAVSAGVPPAPATPPLQGGETPALRDSATAPTPSH
jgi:LAS superfamily LD-carboxypeptidase LdcB